MEFIIYLIMTVLIIGCVLWILKKGKGSIEFDDSAKLPYRVKDNILTDTERSFYLALKLYIGDTAAICPKVGLKDFLFIGKGVGKDYLKYFGKIAQKHIDFLLCDPNTMKPLYGIELDDLSHTNKKTHERDLFIEKVYNDAGFKLIRIPSKSGYTQTEIETAVREVLTRTQVVPAIQNDNMLCPKCNVPMVLRKASRGQNAGKEFYGCTNYPNCKEIINI